MKRNRTSPDRTAPHTGQTGQKAGYTPDSAGPGSSRGQSQQRAARALPTADTAPRTSKARRSAGPYAAGITEQRPAYSPAASPATHILIIGGGAAGMSAAIRIARGGGAHVRVTVCEKSAEVLKKLRQTGNGRCNLSNTDQSLSHYHTSSPDAAKRILSALPPDALRAFFSSLGISLTEEKNGCLYPRSFEAGSVCAAMLREAKRCGIQIVTQCAVSRIEAIENEDNTCARYRVFDAEKRVADADVVLVATGSTAGLARPADSAVFVGSQVPEHMSQYGKRPEADAGICTGLLAPFGCVAAASYPVLTPLVLAAPLKQAAGSRVRGRFYLEIEATPGLKLDGGLRKTADSMKIGATPSSAAGGGSRVATDSSKIGATPSMVAGGGSREAVDSSRLGATPGMELGGNLRKAADSSKLGATPQIIAEAQGEILFTDYGLSGIAAMDLSGPYSKLLKDAEQERAAAPSAVAGGGSREAADACKIGATPGLSAAVILDLAPEYSVDTLEAELAARAQTLVSTPFEHFLDGFIHSRAAGALLRLFGACSLKTPASSLDRDTIGRLACFLKHIRLPLAGVRGPQYAQAMGGGWLLTCFDRGTLCVTGHSGLYAAGEALDVYGDCGGYNLTWAWASAAVCADAIVSKLKLPTTNVKLPDTNVELPDTNVKLPNTNLKLPDTNQKILNKRQAMDPVRPRPHQISHGKGEYHMSENTTTTRTPHEKRARELFLHGYSCCQAVLCAFLDELGLDSRTAQHLAGPFGGGMGRLRLTCGAMTGMAMVAGLRYGYDTDSPARAKGSHYKLIQMLASRFEQEAGSLICGELLSGDTMLRVGKKKPVAVPPFETLEPDDVANTDGDADCTIAAPHTALSDAQQEPHEGAVADSPGLAHDQEAADEALHSQKGSGNAAGHGRSADDSQSALIAVPDPRQARLEADTNPEPEKRSVFYYKKRPCLDLVGLAARILDEYEQERSSEQDQ